MKEWTGMDLASSTRAAESRTKWKGIVANSSLCPDDLPRLWDRIENRIIVVSIIGLWIHLAHSESV